MPFPTIVLLHGQPDSSASFWTLRRELAGRLPRGTRVLAPDRPGYGANLLPATDFAGNVRWLRSWLAEVDAGPTILVGHSWAGGVAALAAAADPSLAGLVLLASIGPGCLVPIDPVLAAPVLGDVIAYATLRLGRPIIRQRARTLILDVQPEADRPFAVASALAMRHRPVWRSFVLEQRAMIRELDTINDALPRIAVPTHLISGTRDPVIPARTRTALKAALPHARVSELAGGHDLQLRQPAQVAELVADFAGSVLPQ